ncbi:MAG: adenosylmethionine decarboxylase [Neisseria sp.]|nr:adenosylmethionine decarboxylase [Neisseria sp.]
MNRAPGSHGLLDLYGCNPAVLRDQGVLQAVLQKAAQAARATVLEGRFHTFGGEGGVTGVLLLAESHISIHTWPEYRFAAADIFLCGQMPMENARRIIEQALQARDASWRLVARGRPPEKAQNRFQAEF